MSVSEFQILAKLGKFDNHQQKAKETSNIWDDIDVQC